MSYALGLSTKRLILLTAVLLLSGCGAGKSIMSMTADLVLPSTSDKILKAKLKELVNVTEADMFGVNTVRRKEVIHKETFKQLVAGIYAKPVVVALPEDGDKKDSKSDGGSSGGSGKKPPKYELTADVNLTRYANADDIKRIFSKCVVKAVLQYYEQQPTIEFPDGEAAFSGKCEPITDPYNDLQQFFARNKKFGYEISYGFPTPFHLLRKENVPDLVALTFIDGSELRGSVAEFEKSIRELRKIFPKTRIFEKNTHSVTPELLMDRLNEQSRQAEQESQKKGEPAASLPNEDEVDRYVRGIVLNGALFSETDDLAQMESRLKSYHNAYPRKKNLLLAKYYLFVAHNQIIDAENIIIDNELLKVDDLYQGNTIKELYESAWPDYYRTALERTMAWIAENTDYDLEELEKQFLSQLAVDTQMSKRKQLLEISTFIEQNYPEVVIYLLVNNRTKPQNSVETKFLNTFNYYSGYDDFAALHDFLLFNIRRTEVPKGES